MKKLSRREDLSSRIRFILMQVLDLKKNQWIPHREEDIFTEVGSANPKKLEVELATLKSNNARLTAALQESTANVGELKRQLEAFKEENVALKSKLLDTETNKGDELNSGELKKEITTLQLKCDSLETELKTKDEKVKDLSTELKDSLSVIENFKVI
ncbi:homer protein homolog 1-like [Artemia franciscana]|uniref:homer protein homolog 1-like n=1 Tax=Artemia franciscana TaxID=6661 RepID=UPI0032D9F5A6